MNGADPKKREIDMMCKLQMMQAYDLPYVDLRFRILSRMKIGKEDGSWGL